MRKIIFVFLIAIFALYQVKTQVRALKRETDALESQLASEHEKLHVLRAEWNFLTQPDRLRRLSTRHLALVPVTAKQLADEQVLEALFRPEPTAPTTPLKNTQDE